MIKMPERIKETDHPSKDAMNQVIGYNQAIDQYEAVLDEIVREIEGLIETNPETDPFKRPLRDVEAQQKETVDKALAIIKKRGSNETNT